MLRMIGSSKRKKQEQEDIINEDYANSKKKDNKITFWVDVDCRHKIFSFCSRTRILSCTNRL